MLGITPVTLRRWCEYHAEHLSEGANPLAGKARRFTGKDIEVLKHVRSLRDRGLTTNDINEQLTGLTFAEIDAQSIDVEPQTNLAVQEGQGDAPAVLVALSSIQAQINVLQKTREDDRNRQREPIYYIAVGFIGALVFVIFLLLLFLLRNYL
jgi:DNA-binding transcriptional MerR regulator